MVLPGCQPVARRAARWDRAETGADTARVHEAVGRSSLVRNAGMVRPAGRLQFRQGLRMAETRVIPLVLLRHELLRELGVLDFRILSLSKDEKIEHRSGLSILRPAAQAAAQDERLFLLVTQQDQA
jgi:hypothetical protein